MRMLSPHRAKNGDFLLRKSLTLARNGLGRENNKHMPYGRNWEFSILAFREFSFKLRYRRCGKKICKLTPLENL